MASEPIECQVVVLRVSIHCEGCKKKVKKVLQNINGVYRCEIDARSNKVSVTASTKLDPYIIVAKLRKSGKQADMWPEQSAPPPQQPPPAESQSEDPKNPADEQSKPGGEPAEKPGADNAEAAAAEPPPEDKQSTAGETSKPAHESKEPAGGEAPAAAAEPQHHHQPSHEAKGKAKQHPPPEMEKQPVDARVTVEYDRGVAGGYGNYMPPPQQHVVMSYNQARPSMSASYYAPAPAPAPPPMARPGPSQGYIDEHYTPSYYGRPSPSPYEPSYYYNPPPQPSPYRYQSYQPPEDNYYYSAPPQRSAFSPPRDGYGDMFNDENANSCSVM